MGKSIDRKQRSKLSNRRKKVVDMRPYAGKIKSFQNIDALSYQKKAREE